MPRLIVPCATALLAALLATTARANHCEGGGCVDPVPTIGPASARVAADGVLAFPIHGWEAEIAFKHFSVTVQDAEGASVDGALELPAGFTTAIWRPAAPWSPGARHTVTTALDVQALVNDAYGITLSGCRVTERVQEIEVDAQPLPAAATPPILVETTHTITPRLDLASLVCCDEAFPSTTLSHGHPCDYTHLHDAATCASLRARGRLTVHYTVDVAALSARAQDNLATRIVDHRDGTRDSPLGARTALAAPKCLRFEVLDLARGDLYVDERCHGDALADQLGDIDHDPAPELTLCAGEPYVCEVKDQAWDSAQCRPWPELVEPEPEPEPCCDCRATAPPPVSMLLALLLGLTFRRTRRERGTWPPSIR